ncbi:DUF1631 family protein [Undibacterium sp. CY7W]|uniref:DUF1631 family protein n=1 Tax=Undibacterium rugosum TaxID=2762291 RepID=A0A923KSA8_9BURK|nr:DUF1631 family protein [Undibacterium rugosum]MBC3934729.1 DUF1631 family protein [Undibacterium rugosum]
MPTQHQHTGSLAGVNPPAGELLRALVPIVAHLVGAQIETMSVRLSAAFLALSETSQDSREANLSFHAGQLLKKNAYAFYYLVAADIEKALRADIDQLLLPQRVAQPEKKLMMEPDLSLVSYEEMDKKLALSRVSRSIELDNAEQYAALNMRIAHLMQKEALSIAQNPFRPELLLTTLHQAWCQFDPETGTHELVLSLLRPDILFDLEPILAELNQALVAKGVLPDLQESYRIRRQRQKKLDDQDEAVAATATEGKLRQYFAQGAAQNAVQSGNAYSGMTGGAAGVSGATLQQLSEFQKSLQFRQLMSEAKDVLRLSQMREQVPDMFATGVEKQTLDLLSQVFDNVFRNQTIPAQVKELISVLQIPVLKAAMLDKEFFFNEHHPARRLIDLLSRYSPAVNAQQAQQDPLFQTMQRNVQRVSDEFDQEVALFEEVVNDLEAFIAKEEQASEQALQAPIQTALRKEKIKQASMTATQTVAVRVGSGEVVAFVETFLENRWTKVLTLAYSVKEEKPQAVEDAIRTMDDLIWSVKPKITLQDRQELLNRLPAILARLNKWLSLIKWEDADRVRFFAELAECHASIVRAPLELSPDKQLEIAVEAAQHAAERRLEKRAEAEKKAQQQAEQQAVAEEDPAVMLVDSLERGVWIELQQPAAAPVKVRLAWVSPMRSLFIFTSSQKEQNFSLPVKQLQQAFREQKARLLELDKVVDRALMEALGSLQPDETTPAAAPDLPGTEPDAEPDCRATLTPN